MNNTEIKNKVIELVNMAMTIQLNTYHPVAIQLNPIVGSLNICIGYEMERTVDLFNCMFEAQLYFFDEWNNVEFYENYPIVKKKLEKILHESFVIND